MCPLVSPYSRTECRDKVRVFGLLLLLGDPMLQVSGSEVLHHLTVTLGWSVGMFHFACSSILIGLPEHVCRSRAKFRGSQPSGKQKKINFVVCCEGTFQETSKAQKEALSAYSKSVHNATQLFKGMISSGCADAHACTHPEAPTSNKREAALS